MPERSATRRRPRALAVFLPVFAVLAALLTPMAPAHAVTLWSVENFSSDSLRIIARTNADVLGLSGPMASGRRWSLLKPPGFTTVILASETLGSVIIVLRDAGAVCTYNGPDGTEVAPPKAGLHCLFDNSPGGVPRVRISRNSPQFTGVRQVGGQLYSVEAEWTVPGVSKAHCAAARTDGTPDPKVDAGIGMYAGTRYYGIGTSAVCLAPGHVSHALRLYFGKLGPEGLRVSLLAPGTHLRAQIQYLGGSDNKYLFTIDLLQHGLVTELHKKIVEDTAKGDVQARDANQRTDGCTVSCTPGADRQVTPTVAGWFITGDKASPLTFDGSVPVTLRINETSPLTVLPVDAPLRTDIFTATNGADGGRFVYRLTTVRDGAEPAGAFPCAALTIDGAFAAN